MTRSERLVDAAIAAVAFALTLALMAAGGANSDADARELDLLGVVLAAASTFPLVAWRHAPLAVFVATAAASTLLNGVDYIGGPPFGPTAALFLLGLAPGRARPRTWVTAATVGGALRRARDSRGTRGGCIPDRAAALRRRGLGRRVGARRPCPPAARAGRELDARAERAERDAERERRLAAAEERTRIARDLHDSAGHAINVILVQAGAARLLGDRDPERSRAALETIEEVARETVGEIDQLVRGAPRDERRAPANGTSSRRSASPRSTTLVDRHRAEGLDVELVASTDEATARSAAVDQAAYRILQEALTNAARTATARPRCRPRARCGPRS